MSNHLSLGARSTLPSPYAQVSYEIEHEADTLTRTKTITKPAATPIGIVATAHNHLSAALPRLSPRQRTERQLRLRRGFTSAVSYAIEQEARLFLIAGDLFDSPTPSNLDRAFVAGELARLRRSGIICLAVSGRHDAPRAVAGQGGVSPLGVYDAIDGLDYFAPGDTLVPRLYAVANLRLAVLGLSSGIPPLEGADPLTRLTIEDAGQVLEQADVALLLTSADVHGGAHPESSIQLASLKTLPPSVRLVVGGQAHTFSHRRESDLDLVTPGATERMDFETPPETAGFAWIELIPDGVVAVRQVRAPEQPREDLSFQVTGLLPPGSHGDVAEQPQAPVSIQRALERACLPETMVRLRLSGQMPPADLRRLDMRAMSRLGQPAFSFELDTSGLQIAEPAEAASPGVLSPAQEVQRLLTERLATASASDAAELRAAADLLLARLREMEAPQ